MGKRSREGLSSLSWALLSSQWTWTLLWLQCADHKAKRPFSSSRIISLRWLRADELSTLDFLNYLIWKVEKINCHKNLIGNYEFKTINIQNLFILTDTNYKTSILTELQQLTFHWRDTTRSWQKRFRRSPASWGWSRAPWAPSRPGPDPSSTAASSSTSPLKSVCRPPWLARRRPKKWSKCDLFSRMTLLKCNRLRSQIRGFKAGLGKTS